MNLPHTRHAVQQAIVFAMKQADKPCNHEWSAAQRIVQLLMRSLAELGDLAVEEVAP